MSKGIYKITNNINNKCYIGKSSNIEERFQYHKKRYKNEKEWDKPLYKAFRKYGIENFSFEIIEEIEDYEHKSNEQEKYWIQYFNCYGDQGYNATIGGDGGITVNNPREKYGKLTNEEVIYLRKRYAECKYPMGLIYEKEFKDKITKRGFQAIWLGQNSPHIMPEVFTAENKEKQIKLNRQYEGVLRRRISLEEKNKCKERIKNGETITQIWKDGYQNVYHSYVGFRDMLSAISLDERLDFNDEFSPL